MSLPEQIRVRIMSESAESIGISPVVVQEMSVHELVGQMLGVTGKDGPRIREILSRGSLVAGGSRFRWEGVQASEDEIASLLVRYPDADASLPFNAVHCFMAVFRSGGRQVVIERTAGEKRRLLRNRSFWDELIPLVVSPAYVEYSWRENADVYRLRVDAQTLEQIRNASRLLAYSTFETQIRTLPITSVDFYVRRG